MANILDIRCHKAIPYNQYYIKVRYIFIVIALYLEDI